MANHQFKSIIWMETAFEWLGQLFGTLLNAAAAILFTPMFILLLFVLVMLGVLD